jgi:hypothetical protein
MHLKIFKTLLIIFFVQSWYTAIDTTVSYFQTYSGVRQMALAARTKLDALRFIRILHETIP